eukprot:gene22015-26524_t
MRNLTLQNFYSVRPLYHARGSLQMRNLTLQNFYSNDSGGVIYAEGGISINITNCVLKNNRARVGAVMYITGTGYAYGPTYVSVTNSVLQDNFGSAAGRAPQNTGGGLLYSGENNIHVLFEQCSLQGNSAESFGGITNLENCTNGGCSVTFHQCDISENSANRESGGVVNIGMCSGGSLHGALVAVTLGDDAKAEVAILDNSEIMDSRSGHYGNVYFSNPAGRASATLTISDSSMTNNHAGKVVRPLARGQMTGLPKSAASSLKANGGLASFDFDAGEIFVTITNSSVKGSYAKLSGGLVYVESAEAPSKVMMSGSVLEGNSA